MSESAAVVSLATKRRRESARAEWREQQKLARLLTEYLDPSVFWSALECKPRSMLSGLFARLRGVKAGVPDLLAIARGLPPVFVELKSIRGIPSPGQRKIAAELVAAGCSWFLVRSSRAALAALFYAGIPFKRRWKPSRLERWEGPFSDPAQRLPQHPMVAAQKREAKRRYRVRRAMRENAAAALGERRIESDFPTSTRDDAELPGTR